MRLDHLLSKDNYGILTLGQYVDVLRSVLKVHLLLEKILSKKLAPAITRRKAKLCSLKTG